MQDLRDYLHEGVALDELWKVAKGDIKYADFVQQRQGSAPPPAQQEIPALPEDLVSFALRAPLLSPPHRPGTEGRVMVYGSPSMSDGPARP